MAHRFQNVNVLRTSSRVAGGSDESMRVAGLEVVCGLNLSNVFRGELETKRLNICFQVFDFAAANEGE